MTLCATALLLTHIGPIYRNMDLMYKRCVKSCSFWKIQYVFEDANVAYQPEWSVS